MASVVHKGQTAGTIHSTLAITAAAAGNVLIVGVAQNLSLLAPTVSDNVSGSGGWTVLATHSKNGTSSTWAAIKTAVGGEIELSVAPGAEGAVQGLSYAECNGVPANVIATAHVDEAAKANTIASPALSSAATAVFAFAGLSGGSSGAVGAWTGTGPMTNIGEASRIPGGYYLPPGALEEAVFTANWEVARSPMMLVVVLGEEEVEPPKEPEQARSILMSSAVMPKPYKESKLAAQTYSYGQPGGLRGHETVLAAYPAAAADSPVVLLFHESEQTEAEEPEAGEPLTAERVKHMETHGKAEAFQAAGYAAFSVNWRQFRNGSPGYPYQNEDIRAAIEWVRAWAVAFNGDPSKIVLVGGSQGGHRALLTALTLNASKASYIRAVASLSGPTNIPLRVKEDIEEKEAGESSSNIKHNAEYLGVSANDLGTAGWLEEPAQAAVLALAEELSPSNHLTASAPFIYYSVSKEDKTPIGQFNLLKSKAEEAGMAATCTFHEPLKGHGYDYFGEIEEELLAFFATALA